MAGFPDTRRILRAFTEAQIVAMVRESEAEGVTVEQVAKKHGVTPTTLYRWRRRS